MPMEHIAASLVGVHPAAFGARPRFLVLDDVLPPLGYEHRWSPLLEGMHPADQAWATEAELAVTTSIIVLARPPAFPQMASLREIGAHLSECPVAAPPVVFVPIAAPGEAAADAGWLRDLLNEFVIDDVVLGSPLGHALALAVRAKLVGLDRKLDGLQEDLEVSFARADEKERILSAMDARWQYLRARLFHAIPPPRNDAEDSVAQTAGGFRFGPQISRNAFGVVKAAQRLAPTTTEQDVRFTGILTVDTREAARSLGDMKLLNTFLKVMHRLAALQQHPNVTRVIETFSSPRHLYVALELGGFRTLFTRLNMRDAPHQGAAAAPLGAPAIKSVMRQLASAVRHLHCVADVCHRDVKPENVSLHEGDGCASVKLFGFELSEVQAEGKLCKRPCGTMPFAAPEVLLSGQPGYDGKAADMWSLGVLLAEIACGLRAFERALPEIGPSCAKPSKTAGTPHRRSAPPAKIAKQVQDALRGPEFVSRLLDGAVPEASALTWLKPVVTGLLTVDHTQRLDAAELEPRVPKGGR